MVLNQQLYEIAFTALGKMELPDFSAHDEEEVFGAFTRLYGNGVKIDGANATFICDEVQRLSGGKTSMQQAEFYTGIKGPNAQFTLSNGEQEKKVHFGPYIPPFGFQE